MIVRYINFLYNLKLISSPQPSILATPVAVATHLDFATASFKALFLPSENFFR
jgi:hypothetical protein